MVSRSNLVIPNKKLYLFFLNNLSEVKEDELAGASSSTVKEGAPSNLSLVKKQFRGKYAISSEEFTSEMVTLATFSFNLNLRS